LVIYCLLSALATISLPVTSEAADPAPPASTNYQTITISSATGPRKAYQLVTTVKFEGPSVTYTYNACVIFCPSTGAVWRGATGAGTGFFLLRDRIFQYREDVRPALRLFASNKTAPTNAAVAELLSRECAALASSYHDLAYPPEYLVSIRDMLGWDALADVGPVFAADGKTEIGRKYGNAVALPNAKAELDGFPDGNVAFTIIAEHGPKSRLVLNPELRPIVAFKFGFPLPSIPTNTVFEIEGRSQHRIW
jgi:hypothetical protein